MLIEFAHSELPARDWNSRELRIGSAADNDLTISGPGVAQHHLRLLHDERGLVLLVIEGAGRVYVNARPVRERALVRAGDSLGIGDVVLRLIKPDTDDTPQTIDSASMRAVAGPLSGRVQAIHERLEIGPSQAWPLGFGHAPNASLSIIRRDDGMHLQVQNLPETFMVSLNGIPTREGRLHDGDQINIGPHRFILDACNATDSPVAEDPLDRNLPEDSAGPRREVWWLIVTAAALALLIATLLLVHL
jgi:predicted component of type VI protein secretion system